MFKKEYCFDQDIFKIGKPIRVHGVDEEGYDTDITGLIKKVEAKEISITNVIGATFTFHSEHFKDHPEFKKDPEYPELGLSIQLYTLDREAEKKNDE